MAALDQAVATLAPAVGTLRACRAVGQPRSSWYRRHRQSPPPPARSRRPAAAPQPRALSAAERAQVLDLLHAHRSLGQAAPLEPSLCPLQRPAYGSYGWIASAA
jgi:putative transposase